MAKVKSHLRRCVGCGKMSEKTELLRVVKPADGPLQTAQIDLTGKLNGRGAYLHKDLGCVRQARKKRGVERTLKLPFSKSSGEVPALAAVFAALESLVSDE